MIFRGLPKPDGVDKRFWRSGERHKEGVDLSPVIPETGVSSAHWNDLTRVQGSLEAEPPTEKTLMQ